MISNNLKIKNYYFLLSFLAGIALPLSTALQNITLPLIVVCVLLDPNIRKLLNKVCQEPLVIVSFIFYSLILCGCLWSTGNNHDIFKMLIKMIGLLELPFIIAFFINLEQRKIAGIGFATGVILTLFFSYISIWLNYPMFHAKIWGLHYGIFRMHMYHSYFLALFATWLLYIVLHKKINHQWIKYLAIAVIAICLHNIYYETLSRTGQLLCLLMFICVFIQWRFRLGVIISAIILFGVVPILIYTSSTVQAKIKTYQENVQQYKHGKFDSQNPSMYLRWTFHKYAKQIIAERPILGYGTGSYPTEYKRLSAIYNNKFENSQPHSDYLWFGAELGYVGMLIFIAFMLTALIRAYTLNPMYREFGIMVTVVYLASCVENGYFTDSVSGLAFFLVIGVIFASKFDPKIN